MFICQIELGGIPNLFLNDLENPVSVENPTRYATSLTLKSPVFSISIALLSL